MRYVCVPSRRHLCAPVSLSYTDLRTNCMSVSTCTPSRRRGANVAGPAPSALVSLATSAVNRVRATPPAAPRECRPTRSGAPLRSGAAPPRSPVAIGLYVAASPPSPPLTRPAPRRGAAICRPHDGRPPPAVPSPAPPIGGSAHPSPAAPPVAPSAPHTLATAAGRSSTARRRPAPHRRAGGRAEPGSWSHPLARLSAFVLYGRPPFVYPSNGR